MQCVCVSAHARVCCTALSRRGTHADAPPPLSFPEATLHLVLRLRGGGKVHGSLARAGKVKGQTPKVPKQDKKKKQQKGRAAKRIQYNRRFVNVVMGPTGKKVGPNNQEARVARMNALAGGEAKA